MLLKMQGLPSGDSSDDSDSSDDDDLAGTTNPKDQTKELPAEGAASQKRSTREARPSAFRPKDTPQEVQNTIVPQVPSEASNPAKQVKKDTAQLHAQVRKFTARIKVEEALQKDLQKDIRKIQKECHNLLKKYRAPKTIEELEEATNKYRQTEIDAQAQIVEVQEQLTSQRRMLQKAQEQQQNREQHALKEPKAGVEQKGGGEPKIGAERKEAGAEHPSVALLTSSTKNRSDDDHVAEEEQRLGKTVFANGSPNTRVSATSAKTSADVDVNASPAGATSSGTMGKIRVVRERSSELTVFGVEDRGSFGSSVTSPTASSPSAALTAFPGMWSSSRPAVNSDRSIVSEQPPPSKVRVVRPSVSFGVVEGGEGSGRDGPRASLAAGAALAALAALHGQAAAVQETELGRLQQRNEGVKREIGDITEKMRTLRKAMKRGNIAHLSNEAIRQIVGVDFEDEGDKPPPEFLQMKKELRQKQNEVRNLRKKWWEDHKDLEVVARTLTANRATAQLNQADPGQVALGVPVGVVDAGQVQRGQTDAGPVLLRGSVSSQDGGDVVESAAASFQEKRDARRSMVSAAPNSKSLAVPNLPETVVLGRRSSHHRVSPWQQFNTVRTAISGMMIREKLAVVNISASLRSR